jgi:hypothetical protein
MTRTQKTGERERIFIDLLGAGFLRGSRVGLYVLRHKDAALDLVWLPLRFILELYRRGYLLEALPFESAAATGVVFFDVGKVLECSGTRRERLPSRGAGERLVILLPVQDRASLV